MSGNEYINMFSAHLFWDVRKEDYPAILWLV